MAYARVRAGWHRHSPRPIDSPLEIVKIASNYSNAIVYFSITGKNSEVLNRKETAATQKICTANIRHFVGLPAAKRRTVKAGSTSRSAEGPRSRAEGSETATFLLSLTWKWPKLGMTTLGLYGFEIWWQLPVVENRFMFLQTTTSTHPHRSEPYSSVKSDEEVTLELDVRCHHTHVIVTNKC